MNVTIGNIEFSRSAPMALIAGPCQIESRDHAFKMASALQEITNRLDIPFVFKSSFDKANRTSLAGERGVGMEKGLEILSEIGQSLNVPTITDIHNTMQAEIAGQAIDALQIPAFLCRQTDLLVAAGRTGKPIMVKKGQFLAPQDMRHVVDKLISTENQNILLCERGTSFGYQNLVADMRGLEIMAQTGYPIIFDATHSVQFPGGADGSSSGNRDHAPVLARAALAVGVAGLFVEVHDQPDQAPSDGANMMHLHEFEEHLRQWQAIDALVKGF